MLTSVDKLGFDDQSRPGAPVEKLGISKGTWLACTTRSVGYPSDWEVASTVTAPRTAYEDRPFGECCSQLQALLLPEWSCKLTCRRRRQGGAAVPLRLYKA
ncbi:hypothetical protein COCOBI_13-0420 [Coccomyxa sp. Obi]|nr:hypothetical protein COCOBI_13-0420 [Coccomyxa sp. Obi]